MIAKLFVCGHSWYGCGRTHLFADEQRSCQDCFPNRRTNNTFHTALDSAPPWPPSAMSSPQVPPVLDVDRSFGERGSVTMSTHSRTPIFSRRPDAGYRVRMLERCVRTTRHVMSSAHVREALYRKFQRTSLCLSMCRDTAIAFDF
jgi:hypothetical protein